MNKTERKAHWENIYQSKALNEVSWYQPTPETSIDFIVKSCPNKDASIIDIGGGDSFLVDHLLKLGYTNLNVLDISAAAIDRAKMRLGEDASKVNWIVSDITEFETEDRFDIWHDRAAFHFLTNEEDIKAYMDRLNRFTNSEAHFVVGTFSEKGPLKCSGIDIKQYSDKLLKSTFEQNWNGVAFYSIDHDTPFKTKQNFIFSEFIKKH